MPVEKPGHQGVWCSNCGYEFSSEPQGEPCSRCGHTARTHGVVHKVTATGTASMSKTVGVTHSARAKVYPDTEARAIPPGRGRSKFFQKIQTGYEFFRKTARWHLRYRLIDRRGNRYREYINDAETGQVIRDKDQRLHAHTAEQDLRKQNCPN